MGVGYLLSSSSAFQNQLMTSSSILLKLNGGLEHYDIRTEVQLSVLNIFALPFFGYLNETDLCSPRSSLRFPNSAA